MNLAEWRVETRVVGWQGNNVLKLPISAMFRDGGAWAVSAFSHGRARLIGAQWRPHHASYDRLKRIGGHKRPGRAKCPAMLRVLGRLPLMDGGACSGGRRPRSLREGNRGQERERWCRWRYGDLTATRVGLNGNRGDWPRQVMVAERAMVPSWRVSAGADGEDLLSALSLG